MLEIRGQAENVLHFPRAIPSVDRIWQVTRWMAAQTGPFGYSWQISEDSDGALLLVPIARPEPGFAIMLCDSEYEVLVCDPDDIDELGPFATMADALAGISHWLALPAIDLLGEVHVPGLEDAFRPAFLRPGPAAPLTTTPKTRS